MDVGEQARRSSRSSRASCGAAPAGRATAAVSSGRLCSRRSRDAARVEQAHLRRGELDRERQALEAPADVGDVGGVVLVDGEAGLDRRRAVDEQHARRRAQRAVEARRGRRVGRRQRGDLVHLLAADPQHDAARHEELRERRGGVQPHEHGRGIDDLLEVVEHDEHAPSRQRVRDALLERRFAVVADAERVRDRRHQQSRLEHALEQHEVDAVGEEVLRRARRLDREPALADAAGADQAHDPALAAGEQVAQARDVVFAADRRGVRDRDALEGGRRRGRRGRRRPCARDSSKRSARSVARSPATCSSRSAAVSNGR